MTNPNQPIVVQGEFVPSKMDNQLGSDAKYYAPSVQNIDPVSNANVYSHGQHQSSYNNMVEHGQSVNEIKGEHQPKKFNDPFWTFLFVAHIIFMVCLAVVNTRKALDLLEVNANRVLVESEADKTWTNQVILRLEYLLSAVSRRITNRELEEEGDLNIEGMPFVVGISAVVGFLLSSLSLVFMLNFAEILIKVGLIFNILIWVVACMIGFAIGDVFTGGLGLFCAAVAAWYSYYVWNRIPFAAANLVAAITAVRANIGIMVFPYLSLVISGLWLFLWFLTSSSTIVVLGDCDADGNCNNEINGFIIFLLFLSLYWTLEVVKNVGYVTITGTVGTWWWIPEDAASCCSSGMINAFWRSVTYSFGSICLGSLLVAIVTAIKQMLYKARDGDDGLCFCIATCLISILEQIIEYFNEWAFVYVGLYGYTFIDAAKNVVSLFKARGWANIILDRMINGVLFMVSIAIGLITGLVCILASSMHNANDSNAIVFFIGFLFGFGFTSLLMRVVSGAVNTVIVCYAEDPNAFQANHPELSNRMRYAWRQAWPKEFNY